MRRCRAPGRCLNAGAERSQTRVRRKETRVTFFLENNGRFRSSLSRQQTTNIWGCFFSSQTRRAAIHFLERHCLETVEPHGGVLWAERFARREPSAETVCPWSWAGRPSSAPWKRPSGHRRRARGNLATRSHPDAGTRGVCFTGGGNQGFLLVMAAESDTLGGLEEGWL